MPDPPAVRETRTRLSRSGRGDREMTEFQEPAMPRFFESTGMLV